AIETDEWFKSINIDTSETILSEIIKHLEAYQNGIQINMNNFGASMNEAASLNYIRKGFSKFNIHHLPKDKFRIALNAKLISSEENSSDSSNEPRNILFELETAARLMLCGFEIERFNDVNFKVYDYDLSIQCKRLF